MTRTNQTRQRFRFLPVILLLLVSAFILLTIKVDDLGVYFQPAGTVLLAGHSPYQDTAIAPFIYWPFALWLFPILTVLPLAHYVIGVIDIILLIAVVRRLKVSYWWCLYPYAIYVIMARQLDLFVLWLVVEAYCRIDYQDTPVSFRTIFIAATAVALGLALKPQIALFWLLPWLWRLTMKQRVQSAAIVAGCLLIPMAIWWLIAPQTVSGLWGDWATAVRSNASYYVGDSPSLLAIGFSLGAGIALALWLIFSRDQKQSRPLLALGLPALRYYSTVVLIGAVPVWLALPVSYVVLALILLTGKPLLWIEPAIFCLYLLWQRFDSRRKAATGRGASDTNQAQQTTPL